jgi:hypothetical protein
MFVNISVYSLLMSQNWNARQQWDPDYMSRGIIPSEMGTATGASLQNV